VSTLGVFVSVSLVTYLLIIAGLLARAIRTFRNASWYLLAASGIMTLIFSSGMVVAAVTNPLEYRYSAISEPRSFPEARHIVVLTGWAAPDYEMPLSGRLNVSSAYRVLMALELYRDRPDCDVIISGSPTTAGIMRDVLVKLGVPSDQLRVENASTSTAESAAHIAPLVGDDVFFLVTSAGHMRRSISAFAKLSLKALPAPTDHRLPNGWLKADLRPGPDSLESADLALREYVAQIWYSLTGRL
jgi:uncharacterized SAM-binding protein YcdF (DUF218 family)